MKIGFVCIYYHPVIGGTETYVRSLATRMARAGHEVTVHTSCSTAGQHLDGTFLPSAENKEGVEIRRTKLHRGLEFLPKYRGEEVIHVSSYGPPYFFIETFRNFGKALVTTPVGEEVVSWHKLRARLLAKPTLRMAKKVIALSEQERRFLTSKCGLNLSRVVHIPLGVSDHAFDAPSGEELEKAVATCNGSAFILTVARVVASKNLQVGIRALAMLPNEVHYVVIGPIADPTVHEECIKLAVQLSVENRLHFTGAISEQAKRALFAASRAVLVTGAEPFSISALEAMAQGKAVVAPDRLSMEETVRRGQSGLLYDYLDSRSAASSLARLLSDKSLSTALGQAGRELARNEHSWEAVSRQTLEVYRQALNSTTETHC